MARNHDAQPNASNPVPRSYTAADITEAVQSDGTRVYTAADWMITIVPASDARQKPLVKTFYNNAEILSFEANLRRGLDVEMLTRNSGTRAPEVDWHSVFTAISNKLPTQDQDAWQVAIDSLDTFQPERKDYLWYPFIPKGEPTSLDGDPGAGKSALVIKIIAHCTTGTPFPTLFDDKSEQPFDPQPVLLLTYEDDPASTILPRVVINGGNPKLVQIVKGKKNAKGDLLPITMQEIDLLGQAIQDYRPALVVFDPIQSFLGQGVDMNHASETRPLLDAVCNLCKEHGCTPLYVRHNGKSQHTKALHAALGSIDITANMRSAMSLFQDPDVPARRILAHTKTNGRLAPSMQIKFVSATHDFDLPNGTILTVEDVRVDWDGRSELTAAELNARQWANTPVEDEEEETALGQARRFLRDLLADGSVLATDVKKAVSEAGISTPTLRRARTLENIIVTRRPVDDEPHQKWPWEWRLPPAVPTEANGDQEDEGDGAGTAMPENFASALCPEQGRHQIIRTPHDTYRCIKCFNEALRHPGCDALGQAHTLAIRDGIAGMEERYCTVCNTIVGSVDEHGDIPF